ncbi:hypothetical protein [Yoonia sp.]|uniref:hypothetical protein n=1 Tax=Yoonia sp. TaxID=2212373 RepID=UPI002DFD141B|nr:hypothetical protein [Yoonia sp.]
MNSGDIFEAIAAVSQLVMAIAVSIGVIVAYRQIKANRADHLEQKKFEIADTLIGLVFELVDRLEQVRDRDDFIGMPQAEQIATVTARLDAIQDTNDIVKSIARLNVRQRAIIQSDAVTAEIEKLFEARIEIFNALTTIKHNYPQPSKDDLATERLRNAKELIRGGGIRSDNLHMRLNDILATIQAELAQSLRLGL